MNSYRRFFVTDIIENRNLSWTVIMKSLKPLLLFYFSILLFLPGCDLIEGIFEAGFWLAILVIIGVIALIIWGISAFSSLSPDDAVTEAEDSYYGRKPTA